MSIIFFFGKSPQKDFMQMSASSFYQFGFYRLQVVNNSYLLAYDNRSWRLLNHACRHIQNWPAHPMMKNANNSHLSSDFNCKRPLAKVTSVSLNTTTNKTYRGVAMVNGKANPSLCIRSLQANTPKCVVKNAAIVWAKNGPMTSQ